MQAVGAFQSGLAAINAGIGELRENANQIAHFSIAPDTVAEQENRPAVVAVNELEETERTAQFGQGIVTPMVGLLEASNQAEVGAKVLQIANDTIGTLVDIRA
ncbi:hypothetical protein [Piscirickettsia litoralis]|uniref:Uncharacterized protein n=1 Tax=Piscirickettsia litoralis TaxID=1891921 RepID=A0ABX3A2N1_9GAMM|nr:hypothetical protein [Piscirickettsia litoralis]ODN43127.1 hypothetical protein BGC07_09655 [Piscirickettsia litoralis]